ncbi:uncharacterized protein BX663DRAFT_582577 [Cokeromyces recurvatus]|uniref:uncharacterized protein n=1 Tax=Cokeromyces recurvatus TaxID=90255 RepID=UPI002220C964|nr:uncharacterized protein BX663DRAFT_582577 [Cokeromyces recurvatus]KAI7898160.1 hypothetical protein BX663DRAFT_582577 [Cokeromyces recurvatus]
MMFTNISSSLNDQTQDRIRAFLNPLIVEIRNRLPSLPVTKETLNNAPFNIIPMLRHILEKYQSIIAEKQQLTPAPHSPVTPQQQLASEACIEINSAYKFCK